MTARQAVLASEVFVHRAAYPTEDDVVQACAEVLTRGIVTFDDVVIFAYGSHFGILTESGIAKLRSSDLVPLIIPELAVRPTVGTTDVRRMLRSPGHGGGHHTGIDAADGRLLLVFDLCATHFRSALADLGAAVDPSFAFIRWSLVFEPQDRETHSAIVNALIKRGSDSAAIAAGSILARAGNAYINSHPPKFIARVPRAGEIAVQMRIVGTILSSLAAPHPAATTSTRWLRYTGLLSGLLNSKLVSTVAVQALKGPDDDLFERLLAGYAMMYASGPARPAAIARGHRVLSKMFGPLESLSTQDRYVSLQHLVAAATIARSIPLTVGRFRRFVQDIQCDRLTRIISPHDYDFERTRLIKLVAVGLTIEDDAIRAAAIEVARIVSALPAGREDALPAEFLDRYPKLRDFSIPIR